ncbi:MAG: dTMP kinase [Burkholderiaceae bacterium]
MTARFITFEGIDGAGKSTHLAAVADRLRGAGAVVVCTREPGGTTLAEQLRGLLLEQPMDALSEALLVFAARRDHLQKVIEPALGRGETVLCDRFTDATFAYQGAGHGTDLSVLSQLERWVQGTRQPDLTIWFDLPSEMAARRRAQARAADRFEQQDQAFFERVRGGYQARQHVAPQRFARIDAAQDRDAVWRQIVAVLEARAW